MAVIAASPYLKDKTMYGSGLQDLNNEDFDDGNESADSGNEDLPTTITSHVLSAREAEQQELRDHQLRNTVLTRTDDNTPARQDVYDEERRRIIDRAREYQQELYERARDENIIAVLDTGMGKTLIAVMLIRDVLEKDLMKAAEGAPRKSVFFLANRWDQIAEISKLANLGLAFRSSTNKQQYYVPTLLHL